MLAAHFVGSRQYHVYHGKKRYRKSMTGSPGHSCSYVGVAGQTLPRGFIRVSRNPSGASVSRAGASNHVYSNSNMSV